MSTTQDVADLVQDMLREQSKRWLEATVGTPKLDQLEDMPGLPGNMSIQQVVEFLARCSVYEYPRPTVTVDVVVFGAGPEGLSVLLIKRGRKGEPFEDYWALPGGFVNKDEDLEEAARRELREETHANLPYIEQLATFGTPGRDPRGHVISVAFLAWTRCDAASIRGDDDALDARWWPVTELPKMVLAFDHEEILNVAVHRMQTKLQAGPFSSGLLPEVFAMADLRQLYEMAQGRKFHPKFFKKQILAFGVLESAQAQRLGGRGRPPALWRLNRTAYDAIIEGGETFEV